MKLPTSLVIVASALALSTPAFACSWPEYPQTLANPRQAAAQMVGRSAYVVRARAVRFTNSPEISTRYMKEHGGLNAMAMPYGQDLRNYIQENWETDPVRIHFQVIEIIKGKGAATLVIDGTKMYSIDVPKDNFAQKIWSKISTLSKQSGPPRKDHYLFINKDLRDWDGNTCRGTEVVMAALGDDYLIMLDAKGRLLNSEVASQNLQSVSQKTLPGLANAPAFQPLAFAPGWLNLVRAAAQAEKRR